MSESSEYVFVWRCECGEGHFLTVSWGPADERPDGQAEVNGTIRLEGDFRPMLRDRLRHAWRLLRDGYSHHGVGVALDARKAREIATALAEFADAARPLQLPPEIEAVIEEGRRHPERRRPRPVRTTPWQGVHDRLDEAEIAAERERLRAEQVAYRKLEGTFPWLAHLPISDARRFMAEIAAWQATAEAYADPEVRASLSEPADGEDHGPVTPP